METNNLLIAFRFAQYLALLPLFGVALFGLYAPDRTIRCQRNALTLRYLIGTGVLLGLIFSFANLVAMTASMMGISVTAVDQAAVTSMLTAMAAGTAWIIRAAALALTLGAVLLLARWPTVMVASATIASGIALAMLAWTGHGGMDSGTRGLFHVGSDIVHLLAAGTWLGGIMALGLLLVRSPTPSVPGLAHRALDRFALVGTIAVALLMLTGLVNSWLMIGPDRLRIAVTTLYGQLLLLKLALFAAMLALAANNRFRLTPALGRAMATHSTDVAVTALRRSLLLEAAAATGILALVAWLGTLEPPISMM